MENKIVQSIISVLSQLEHLESPLLIAEIILTALMTHTLKKVNAASNSTTVESSSSADVVSDPVPEPASKTTKTAKKQLEKEMQADLALFFSSKSDDELTEEESKRCAAVLAYLEALK